MSKCLIHEFNIISSCRRSDIIVQFTKTEKVWWNGMKMVRILSHLDISWSSDDLRLFNRWIEHELNAFTGLHTLTVAVSVALPQIDSLLDDSVPRQFGTKTILVFDWLTKPNLTI